MMGSGKLRRELKGPATYQGQLILELGGRPKRGANEEATQTALRPAEPHGPRRCGGPEHSVGLSH